MNPSGLCMCGCGRATFTDGRVSVHEQAARTAKAAAIAAHMAGRFGELAVRGAEIATDDQWRALATGAGQHYPSEETRAEVRSILAGYDRARRPLTFAEESALSDAEWFEAEGR